MHRLFPRLLMLCLPVAGLLSACGPAELPSGITDPYETANRERHAFNRAVDQAFLRPTAKGYDSVVPVPVQAGVANFANNLDAPGHVVNNVLQLRLIKATGNSVRFLINSTVGIGGLFDPATAMGLPAEPTDFGETLHIWGTPEGNYVELPFVGPSTNRDAAGFVMDQILNPLRWVLPSPEKYIDTAADATAAIGTRSKHADFIDSVLYESADSYAQARLLYLQNRRFKLGGEAEDTYFDPYEDSEVSDADPISDPYFDPYAE